MKVINISLSVVIIVLLSVSCSQKKTDVQHDGLKGNVKSIISCKYEYKMEYGQLKKTDSIIENKIEYDKNGYKTLEEKSYRSDGRAYIRTRYNYYKTGLVGEKIEGIDNLEYTVYKYDSNDSVKELLFYGADRSTLVGGCKYEKHDENTVIKNFYGDNGQHLYKYIYIYSDKGELVERKKINKLGDCEEKITWKYNLKGNCIEKSIFDFGDTYYYGTFFKWYGNEQPTKKVFYEYDERENLLMKEIDCVVREQGHTIFYSDGSDKDVVDKYYVKLIYSMYDKNGNIIKESTYFPQNMSTINFTMDSILSRLPEETVVIKNEYLYNYKENCDKILSYYNNFYDDSGLYLSSYSISEKDKKGNVVKKITYDAKNDEPIGWNEYFIIYY